MTSPTPSPQKPNENQRKTPQKSPARSLGAAISQQRLAVPANKWQWQETSIPTSGVIGWTRVWRYAKLLLQANC